MKKFTLLSLAAMAFSFNVMAENITLPYFQDFSSVVSGDSESTGGSSDPVSAGVLAGLNGIDEVATVYSAGGKIKFASSKNHGSIITHPIEAAGTQGIKVSFKASPWIASGKTTVVKITYGTTVKNIGLEHTISSWPIVDSAMETYSVEFEALAEPTSIKFESTSDKSTERRFFFDDLKIEDFNTDVAVSSPVFVTSSLESYTGSVDIEISSPEEGAQIFYTLDGSTPTVDATLYDAPFSLTKTTTVKAVAVKDELVSSVVSATYTVLNDVVINDIASFMSETSTTDTYVFSNPVSVVYQKDNNLYFKDQSGYMLCFGEMDVNYNNGDVIDGLKGNGSLYGGARQLSPSNSPVAIAGEAISPDEMDVTEISKSDLHKFVKIGSLVFAEAVVYDGEKSVNGNAVCGDGKIVVRDNFKHITANISAGDVFEFIGFVSVYNGNIQLYPVSLSKTTGLSSTSLSESIKVIGNTVVVPAEAGDMIEVFNISGQKVYSVAARNGDNAIEGLAAKQVYVVKSGSKVAKVVLR